MKKKFLLKLGKRIRQIRRDKGISQVDLAKSIETAQPNITRLENGTINPTIYFLSEVCTALGITLDELLKGLK